MLPRALNINYWKAVSTVPTLVLKILSLEYITVTGDTKVIWHGTISLPKIFERKKKKDPTWVIGSQVQALHYSSTAAVAASHSFFFHLYLYNTYFAHSEGCIYSLDWTTGLTFDPKILTRNGHFALVGSPRMLSCPFSLVRQILTDLYESDQASM